MGRQLKIRIIIVFLLLIIICYDFKAFPDILKSYKDHSSVIETKTFLKSVSDLKRDTINQKKVGYISEKEPKAMFNDESMAAEFILIQYSLIPHYVYNTYDYPIVIGNFHNKLPDPDFLSKRGLTVIKKYNNGLLLLKNKTKYAKLIQKQIKNRMDNMVL